MSEQKTITASGQCLCNKVRFECAALSLEAGACHCKTCRQWGGGAFISSDCGDKVTFQGQQYIKIFDSSEWAERGFCSECGSHLFYRLKHNGQTLIPTGLFNDELAHQLTHQVFVDERPDYYEFANQTEEMTGAEVFAKYAPQ